MNDHFDHTALIWLISRGERPSKERLAEASFSVKDVRDHNLGTGTDGEQIHVAVYDVVNSLGCRGLIFSKGAGITSAWRHKSQLVQSNPLQCEFQLTDWFDLYLVDKVGELHGVVPSFSAMAGLVISELDRTRP